MHCDGGSSNGRAQPSNGRGRVTCKLTDEMLFGKAHPQQYVRRSRWGGKRGGEMSGTHCEMLTQCTKLGDTSRWA